MVKCPECEKELTPKGLYGHMKFAHGITSDKPIRQAVAQAEKTEKRESLVKRISELHAELIEIRRKRDDVERTSEGDGFLSSDAASGNLKKLYDHEEKRVEAEIETLMKQAGLDKKKSGDSFFDF